MKFVDDEGKGTDLVSVMSTLSALSDSIAEGYSNLSGTFTINQKRIAASINYPDQVEYLKRIAESGERTAKLTEQQLEDAKEDAKTERRRFYVALGATIILGVVAIIVGLMALF